MNKSPSAAEVPMLDDVPQALRAPGRRTLTPAADGGLVALITASTWLLQSLPSRVIEEQRGAVIDAMANARNLTIEIVCSPTSVVRVRDAGRLLLEISAAAVLRGRRHRASRPVTS
jgi:hypothetical protein